MNIYIMSRGRAGRTNTQKWIPKSWKSKTFFVVPEDEVDAYESALHKEFNVVPAASHVTNYSQKFQWIMDGLPYLSTKADPYDKCLIIDDDLVFSSRSDPNRPDSLISIRDAEATQDLWPFIERLLDTYALAGVHPRQMGQNAQKPYVNNGRIICMQGINRAHTHGIKVDQYPILADVVLNLTLLSRGYANALATTFFQDHGPCQAPGGCSIYRTMDMQRSAVLYLASRWPEFVKVVERRPKVAKWMGEVRTEYTARWKALYDAGNQWRKGLRPSPDRENTFSPHLLDKGAL